MATGLVSPLRRQLMAAKADAAIGSYLKCGTTWLSALLRHVMVDVYHLPPETMPRLFLSDHKFAGVFGIPANIPHIFQDHFLTLPGEPGIRGTAESLAPFQRTPMIVILRDFKDMLISHYMFVVFRFETARFEGSPEDFVRDPGYGVEKVVHYYNKLAEYRRVARAPSLVTHYEALWADTAAELRRILDFLGIEKVSDAIIANAVERCSFQNMRKMETAATRETVQVPNLFRSVHERPEALHVRKGGSGNWREHLSAATGAWIDEYVAEHLDAFYAAPKETAATDNHALGGAA